MFVDLVDTTGFEKVAHYIIIASNIGISTGLAFGLRKFLQMYRTSLKITERIDHLWKDFCDKHDLEFVALEED